MARVVALLTLLLLVAMVAGLLDYLGSARTREPPLLDLEKAAAYSREYRLAFDPTLGGASHIPRALELNAQLAASVNQSRSEASQVLQVLALQRGILDDAQRHAGDPAEALVELVGAGGGSRVQAQAADGRHSAELGLRQTSDLEHLEGYARDGIGWAPGAPAMRDYWQKRLAQWQGVEAQLAEAHGAYTSFFVGASNLTVEAATHLLGQADGEVEQLYAVPQRVAPNGIFSTADAVGAVLQAASRQGQPASLLVGVDANGDVVYCAVVTARLCRSAPVEVALNVTQPGRVGIVSSANLEVEVPDAGGALAVFNTGSRPTGHLGIEARAVDGSWNSTVSMGPVPADGARVAVFSKVGDGAALVTVRGDGQVLAQWVGQMAQGVGVLMD